MGSVVKRVGSGEFSKSEIGCDAYFTTGVIRLGREACKDAVYREVTSDTPAETADVLSEINQIGHELGLSTVYRTGFSGGGNMKDTACATTGDCLYGEALIVAERRLEGRGY